MKEKIKSRTKFSPELEALIELAGTREIFKDVKRDWDI